MKGSLRRPQQYFFRQVLIKFVFLSSSSLGHHPSLEEKQSHKFGSHSNHGNDAPDLINLSCTEDTVSSAGSDAGPRLVSVRIPVGSNNILLDNASANFTAPILYKSRTYQPTVHSSPPTKLKSDVYMSSDEETILVGRMRTETRI